MSPGRLSSWGELPGVPFVLTFFKKNAFIYLFGYLFINANPSFPSLFFLSPYPAPTRSSERLRPLLEDNFVLLPR